MARVYNQGVANKQKKEGTYSQWYDYDYEVQKHS